MRIQGIKDQAVLAQQAGQVGERLLLPVDLEKLHFAEYGNATLGQDAGSALQDLVLAALCVELQEFAKAARMPTGKDDRVERRRRNAYDVAGREAVGPIALDERWIGLQQRRIGRGNGDVQCPLGARVAREREALERHARIGCGGKIPGFQGFESLRIGLEAQCVHQLRDRIHDSVYAAQRTNVDESERIGQEFARQCGGAKWLQSGDRVDRHVTVARGRAQ